MGKHRARIPRRRLRAAYAEKSAELSRLRRAYGILEEQWSETFQELIRLQELYEPVPETSWGIVNAAAQAAGIIDSRAKELEEWDPEQTEEVPVYTIGIDPGSGPDPSGIAVIKVDADGTAEVIKEEETEK